MFWVIFFLALCGYFCRIRLSIVGQYQDFVLLCRHVSPVQQLFVLSRNASLTPMWGGAFLDDTITDWPRRELVSRSCSFFVVSRTAPFRCVTRQNGCGWEWLIGNAFCRWSVIDAKYITTASGESIFSQYWFQYPVQLFADLSVRVRL